LDSLKKNWEGLIWVGLLSSVLVASFIFDDDAIKMGMTVYLCWLLLAYLLSQRSKKYQHWQLMAMLLLLSSALLLRTGVIVFQPRVLGEETQESAALVLREVTQPGDDVLTCTPSVVFLADRNVANFCGADIPEFDSSEDFIEWMRAQGFEAIYLDRAAPEVFRDLTLEQRRKSLTQVFSNKDGEAYIFLLNPEN